jgi:membrane fusion protein (multidrug efflux system)
MTKQKLAGLAALIVGAVVFMLWLAGLLHFGKIAPGTQAVATPAAPGRVVTVQETAIPQRLEVLGSVISKSLAQVSSQVPGRVTRTWVEAGSRVKPEDPLVSLTGQEYQARVNQARAGVAQTQAQLKQVAANYRRYQFLRREGAASPQEFEAMEARYKAAQAAQAQAQAQLAEASTLKGYTVVRAPGAGVVAERRVAVGDLAQPGQTLVSLYNPQDLQIEGDVNDAYRQAVKVGIVARVEVPAAKWQAEVPLAEIFPISQAGSRTFKVRTGPVEAPDLMPGMFARLELPLGETRGLLIPRAAVRRVGQLSMVRVAVDGGAHLRQVKLGRELNQQVEVLAGLKPGEKILLPE